MSQKPWELDLSIEEEIDTTPKKRTGSEAKPWEQNLTTSPDEKIIKPPLSQEPTGQGRFASGANNVAKSFLATFAGVPESVAIAAKKLGDTVGIDKEKPLDAFSTYQLGQWLREAAEQTFPTNPEYRDEFLTTTLTGAAGSAAGFLATMLASKGIRISSGATGAILGSMTQGAEGYLDAKANGADDPTAFKSWLINGGVGVTEAIPMSRALDRINGVTKGWLSKLLTEGSRKGIGKIASTTGGRVVTKGFEGGVEELIQESFQGFASNATAKGLYDAERSLWEGVGEGGLAGFIVGMGLNGLGSGVKSRINKVAKSIENNADYKLTPEEETILTNYAKERIASSKWINYLENPDQPAPLPSHSTATHFREGAVDNYIPEGMSQDEVDAVYIKPQQIKTAIRMVLFPEFIFKRQMDKGLKTEAPMKLSVKISSAQLAMGQHERDYESHYKKIFHGMKEDEIKQAREAMDLAYLLRNSDLDQESKIGAKAKLEEMYAKNPKLINVLEGVDERGGLIEFFEDIKKRFQESTRDIYLNEMEPTFYKIFSDVIDADKDIVKAVEDHIDIESIAREEFIERQTKATGGLGTEKAIRDWNSKEKVREKKITTVRNRYIREASKAIQDYKDIASWGLKDFQTRIELGNYKVIDSDNKTVAWAPTAEEARKKAAEIRQRIFQETGTRPSRYIIKAQVSRINPTAKRKDVLKGEVNILKSLPRYVHAMEKRIVMNPIISEFQRMKKENPDDFTPDVNGIIQQQINDVMGSNYEWIERVVDEWAVSKGLETGKYRKYIGIGRKIEANVKLGYRPTAAYINMASGFGMTYVKTGAEFWNKGWQVLRAGEYIDKDGNSVDLKKVTKNLEEEGQLGVDFAVGEDGTISVREPIWHPFGGKFGIPKPLALFQAPEGPIRKHGFAANYVMQRELFNKSHEEAVWLALQGVRFQQSTYNTAAIPEILRSPTGKLLGQFRTYMINQAQFWSTLSKAELVRMLEVQMLLAGPRGLVYFLRSIPLLAAFSGGLLDELEKEATSNEGIFGKVSKGITGLVGLDLSAPATFQFPNKPIDWLGSLIGDTVKLFKDVVVPGAQTVGAYLSGKPENAPIYVLDNTIEWLKGLAPITYYWDHLLQSVMLWEGVEDIKDKKYKQAMKTVVDNFGETIWIRDSNGNKAYEVSGVWDRLALASGAKLSKQSEYQALEQIWNRNMEIRGNNRRKVLNNFTRKLVTGREIDKGDTLDLVLYGVDPRSIPDRIQWMEMTPEQRNVLKARVLDRAEAIDHFNFDKIRRLQNE